MKYLPIACLCLAVFIRTSAVSQTSASPCVPDNGDRYLAELHRPASGFKSNIDKTLYLAEHLDEVDNYYDLASGLSACPSKPAELLAALRKKLLQCLLLQTENRNLVYQGIPMGLMQKSPDPNAEYTSFLEEVVRENSPWCAPEYLSALIPGKKVNPGTLFSLSGKVRILAFQYLLALNPVHDRAMDFFLHYPVDSLLKPGARYFIAAENNWSGKGIVDENGQWILPPFYYFGSDGAFRNGFIKVMLKYKLSNPSHYNWVDPRGRFLYPGFVHGAGDFVCGRAKCTLPDGEAIMDTTGKRLDIPDAGQYYLLENGCSYSTAGEKLRLFDPKGRLLTILTDETNRILWDPTDSLLLYMKISNWPGSAKFGYLDIRGNRLTAPLYYTSSDEGYEPGSFYEHRIKVLSLDYKKTGLVNSRFERLIAFMYDDIRILNRKYLLAYKNGGRILYDMEGHRFDDAALPVRFNRPYETYFEGDIGVSEYAKLRRLVDLDGNLVRGFENNQVGQLKDGLIELKKDRWGVMDERFQERVPFKYDQVIVMSADIVVTKIKGRFQCVHIRTGERFDLPEGLDDEGPQRSFDGRFLIFRKNGKAGVVDTEGRVVLPFQYQDIKSSF